MNQEPSPTSQPVTPASDPLDVLIDRVAEAVVQKLEDRRKIDLLAEAVLERIRLGASYAAPPRPHALGSVWRPLLAVALCACAATHGLPQDSGLPVGEPGNLLSNPSMEWGLPARGLVLDWTPAPEFPGPAYRWTDDLSRSGQFSLSIDGTLAPSDANGGWQAPAFLSVPGVLYRFEGSANPVGQSGPMYLALAWFAQDHTWLGNTRNGSIARSTGEWVRLAVADIAPAGAAYARPYLRSDGGAGVTFLDDASLRVVEGDATAIPMANGDFELMEPGLWLAEGRGAVRVSDGVVARGGDGCLALVPSEGRSAWASPQFGTGTMGQLDVAVRLFVDCSRARAGRLAAEFEWLTADGVAGRGEPTILELGGAGYREVLLPVVRPATAAYGRLALTASGLDGPVYLDEASFALKARTAPTRAELAAATARAYMAALPSPDRVEARFTQTFPDLQQRAQLGADLAEALAQGVVPRDDTLDLFLLQCRYHAGDPDGCRAVAEPLTERLGLNDLRLDLAMHYAYHASRAIAEGERSRLIQELDAQRERDGTLAAKRALAKAYEEAQAPERAAKLYEQLTTPPDTDIALWAAFRAGMSYSLAGRHTEAVERLGAFLQQNAWTRWAPEARAQMGESLCALHRYRECVELLRPALSDGKWAPRAPAARLLVRAYRGLAGDPDAEAQYRRLFRVPGLPQLAYVGLDGETQGNWVGAYGRAAFVLCGMASPRDIVGGSLLPVRVAREDPDKRQATTVAWADSTQELPYSCYTGDPANPPRLFLHVDQTDDPRALANPMWGRRTFALWDDRGETHPFDGRGPDLYSRLEIPAGAWVLSLYFLDWDFDPEAPFHAAHRATVTDLVDGHSVSFEVDRFGGGVYHSVAVIGPMEAEVCVRKGDSLCAALAGVLLDPLQAPRALAEAAQGCSDELRGLLDLCASDPVRSAVTGYPEVLLREAAPADCMATMALAAALPGRLAAQGAAARAWLASATAVDGKSEAVAAAHALFTELVRSGDIGPAKALADCLLEADPSSAFADEAAQRLRLKDAGYAQRLLEHRADALIASGKPEALRAEALEWYARAENDRAQSGNMRRTTFALSEFLLRRLEAAFGPPALGEEGLWALACSRCDQNWFDWGWKQAAEELERFLRQYPGSDRVPAAVERLAKCSYIASQKDPCGTPSPNLLRTAQAIDAARTRFAPSCPLAAAMVKLGLAHENRREYEEALRWFEEVTAYPEDVRRIHGIDDLVARVRQRLEQEGGGNDG